jgi:hypothetical protein
MAVDDRQTYRSARYYYTTLEGIKETLKERVLGHFMGKARGALKLDERFPNKKWILDVLQELL